MKILKVCMLLILTVAASVLPSRAQSLNVALGDVIYSFPAPQMGEALCNGPSSISIMGTDFAVSDITSMRVEEAVLADNTVAVAYDGDKASVTIAGNIARHVAATVVGAHVSIIQRNTVGDESGEIVYVLSGSAPNGSFCLEGSYKASLELRGLTLTNPEGAALDIRNGKRIALSVKSGTVNNISDGAAGSQKGALVCKGHLELKGGGELNVSGNTAHAIYAKEYVAMKNCTVNVLAAVKDGINCAQYFMMESGELTIAGTGDDGIQTSFKDETAPEADDIGSITIAGGKLKVDVTAAASKGLKADGDICVAGGDVAITVSGPGKWDSENSKTKASSCIGADGNVSISGGTCVLSASGSGGKGISCDGALTIGGGEITVKTTGGMFAYVNGREYDGYTGNTDNLASDAKSSPKGMKADGDMTINGGVIRVSTSGNGGEGMESKGVITINEGEIYVCSYDDAINSSGHMYVNGGDITVVASNNDGLDSNGNLYIRGGVIRAFGTTSPECGIDANEEGGYSVYFTGGTMIAVGGGNSVPSSAESTQAYVSGSGQATAGSVISLKSGSTLLASFTVPDEYKSGSSSSGPGGGFRPGGGGGPGGSMGGSSILITCPGLTSGSTYTLDNNGTTSTLTATLRGGSSGGGRPF